MGAGGRVGGKQLASVKEGEAQHRLSREIPLPPPPTHYEEVFVE